MKLVIDSNRFFAAFIKDSVSRAILLSKKFEFFAPLEILEEILKYKDYLIKKSKINSNEFDFFLSNLLEPINLVFLKKYDKFLDRAIKIMKDIYIKDAPFLAIGLAFNLDGIWSDDKDFLEQNELKTFSTMKLL
ncbi:MAG: PIN domain-containing protein, partial [Candidatus Helarchaeota archaeon]